MITNKKTLYLFGGIVVLGIIGIVAAKASGPGAPKPSSSNSTSTSATKSSQVTIRGVDAVLNFGVSSDQESDLRYAINKYASTLTAKPKLISIKNVAAAPYNSEDPNAHTAITFDLTLDSSKLKANFQYFTLTKGNLTLTDPSSGSIVFSSGDIDLSTGTS